MYEWLKKLQRLPKKVLTFDEEIKVYARLQRACAVVLVSHEQGNPAQLPSLPAVASLESGRLIMPIPAQPAAELEAAAILGEEESGVVAAPSWFRRLVNRLTTPSVMAADRRSAPRHPFGQVHLELEMLVGPARWPTLVSDISSSGVGLVCGLRHPPGTSLQLTVADLAHGRSWPLTAQVVRILLLPDGQWVTCCSFTKPLAAKELEALL